MKGPWVLKGPDGTLHLGTFGFSKDDCWEKGWYVVSAALGREWEKKYWKRWDASVKAAEKHGTRWCGRGHGKKA
jgi:hypothetical protein